jgi:hypothetical protein
VVEVAVVAPAKLVGRWYQGSIQNVVLVEEPSADGEEVETVKCSAVKSVAVGGRKLERLWGT